MITWSRTPGAIVLAMFITGAAFTQVAVAQGTDIAHSRINLLITPTVQASPIEPVLPGPDGNAVIDDLCLRGPAGTPFSVATRHSPDDARTASSTRYLARLKDQRTTTLPPLPTGQPGERCPHGREVPLYLLADQASDDRAAAGNHTVTVMIRME